MLRFFVPHPASSVSPSFVSSFIFKLDFGHQRLHREQIADVLVVLHQYNLVRVDVELLAGVKQLEATGPGQEVFDFELSNQFPVGCATVGCSVRCSRDGGDVRRIGSCSVGWRPNGAWCGRIHRCIGADLKEIRVSSGTYGVLFHPIGQVTYGKTIIFNANLHCMNHFIW